MIEGSQRWLLLWLPLLTAGCQKPLDNDECNELLDRYVELLNRTYQTDATGDQVLRQKRDARAKAARDPSFKYCQSEVSRSQYECAMNAENADKLEQCLL